MKKTKILTVLGVLLAMGITACGKTGGKSSTGPSSQGGGDSSQHVHTAAADAEWQKDESKHWKNCQENDGGKVDEAAHAWVADDSKQNIPAGCATEGKNFFKCSVCGQTKEEVVKAAGHDFGEGAELIDEFNEEGSIEEKMYKCKNCDVTSIRWSALDYDVEKTTARSTKKPESRDSGKAIRFDSTANYQDKDTTKKGCHIVYNVYIPRAADHLSFYLKTSKRTDSTLPPVINMVDGDNAKGYEYVNEELVRPATRYGLKIDGEVIIVPEDKSGQEWKDGVNWYSFPGEYAFDAAGVHEIEFYNLGGYRADFYEFALVGFASHDHVYEAKVGDNAAGEGYPASSTYACTSNCGLTAIRWAAKDYDASSTEIEATASDGSIRMNSAQQANAAGDNVTGGGHLIYKVNVPAAVEHAGLQFYIQAHNQNQAIFDAVPGDSGAGKDFVDGAVVDATKRYALYVNDVRYALGTDPGKSTAKAWFTWPVDFPLKAGVNKIEIVSMGGYRAKMYDFQVTGLPAVQGSTFDLSAAEWKSDNNGHWKELATQEGVKFMYHKHLLVADTSKTDVPADCEHTGTHYAKCSVCGKEVEQTVPALGHKWVDGAVTVDAEDSTKATQATECSVCHQSSSVTGGVYGTFVWKNAIQTGSTALDNDGKVNTGDYNLVVFNVPAAGTYTITLPMQGSNGNGAKVMGSDGQNFGISANGVAGTFYGTGKTYTEFFGENQTAWVDALFGEVQLKAGKNEIKITAKDRNYRTKINKDGNVTVAPKAAAAA